MGRKRKSRGRVVSPSDVQPLQREKLLGLLWKTKRGGIRVRPATDYSRRASVLDRAFENLAKGKKPTAPQGRELIEVKRRWRTEKLTGFKPLSKQAIRRRDLLFSWQEKERGLSTRVARGTSIGLLRKKRDELTRKGVDPDRLKIFYVPKDAREMKRKFGSIEAFEAFATRPYYKGKFDQAREQGRFILAKTDRKGLPVKTMATVKRT